MIDSRCILLKGEQFGSVGQAAQVQNMPIWKGGGEGFACDLFSFQQKKHFLMDNVQFASLAYV